jgi:hypothetical protein
MYALEYFMAIKFWNKILIFKQKNKDLVHNQVFLNG